MINLIRFNQLIALLAILAFFNVAVTSLDISQVSASTQSSTEILVAYTEAVNVDATGTFQMYVGVYDPSQGFLGNQYIEYYHEDTPQFRRNTTTDINQFTIISWDLSNSAGLNTINITYDDQFIPLQVFTSNNTVVGPGQVDFSAFFENDYPSIGADNNANIDLFDPGVPFLQLDGSEIFSVETTILINSQPHNMVLGFAQGTAGFYFDPANVITPFITPIWGQVGTSLPVQISFSGNSLYAPLSKSYTLPLRAQGQDLSISLPAGITGGDRSSFGETTNTIDLLVELSGDNPTGTILDLKFQLSGYPETFWLSNYGLTDFISTVPFSIPHNQPLGTGTLIAEITRNGTIQDQKSVAFTAFDELAVSISFSSEILIPNESVDLLVYTYREDTYLPEAASVSIYEDESLVTPIISLTTDPNGQKTTNYIVSNVIGGGIQNWWIKIDPLANSTYQGQTIIWPVNIYAETQIDVNSDVYILNRGEDVSLTAQVTTNIGFATEGTLAFVSQETETILAEYDLATTTDPEFLFEVDQDFPKGISYFRWDYLGTDVFSPAEYTIGLHVYSQPIFLYTTLNQSYTLPGDSVLIHGYLLQDDSQNSLLDGATTIELWEINSTGEFLVDTFMTTETGEFSYEYLVPSETLIGIYNYQLRFAGDDNLFLRSSQNQPLLELLIRAEMGLFWEVSQEAEFILGGQSLETTVFGRPGLTYEIAYSTEELLRNDTWVFIAEAEFIDVDQQNVNLSLPDISGPITLRLLEVQSETFEFYPLTLYTLPTVNLEISETSIRTFETTHILISSSESFKFRLNGAYVYSSEESFENEHLWEYSFIEPGKHIIYVEVIGSYLAQQVFEFPITVYESINVEFLTPIETAVPVGSYQTLSLKLTNSNDIPLTNVHVQLVSCYTCTEGFTIAEQILAEGFTSPSGELTVQAQIIGQYFAISVSEDEDRYILPLVHEIFIPIEQVLELETDQNAFVIIEGTSTDLIFKIKFQYSNQYVSDVPLRILVIDPDNAGNILYDILETTGENGDVTINLGKTLELGTYQIRIISEDSRYQPLQVSLTLQVVPASTILDQISQGFWILPAGGTILLGLGLAGAKLRRKITQT